MAGLNGIGAVAFLKDNPLMMAKLDIAQLLFLNLLCAFIAFLLPNSEQIISGIRKISNSSSSNSSSNSSNNSKTRLAIAFLLGVLFTISLVTMRHGESAFLYFQF
jgi:hypothetical protein